MRRGRAVGMVLVMVVVVGAGGCGARGDGEDHLLVRASGVTREAHDSRNANRDPRLPDPVTFRALARRRDDLEAAHRWFVGLAAWAYIAGAAAADSPTMTPPGLRGRPPVAAAPVGPVTRGGPWVCIANAETGGVAATGPTYWTVFGLVTGVVDEYGSPAQQAAVFGGTADLATQLDIAVRFAADHGFGGWGVLTRQKCGL